MSPEGSSPTRGTNSVRAPGLRTGTRTEFGQSELEDDTGWDSAGQDVVDGFVDLVDLAVDGDYLGPPGGVQGEDVTEVVAGADDRADDRLAVDHGVEDRQTQRRVVSGQGDTHQASAAAQRPVGLVERSGRRREGDGHIGAAERLDRLDRIGSQGVDDMVGAEFGGHRELVVLDVHCDDEPTGDTGVLQGQVPQPPDAEDRDCLGGGDPGDLDCLVGRHTRTRQRRGVPGGDAVWYRRGERRGDDGVLGERAVDGVARILLLLAQRLPPAVAVTALTARVTEPRDRDPVTDRTGAHTGAELLDITDALVPGNERRCRLYRPVAVRGVDIGVAQPACLDPDEDLTVGRLRDREILYLQGGVEIGDNCCSHGVLRSEVKERTWWLGAPGETHAGERVTK